MIVDTTAFSVIIELQSSHRFVSNSTWSTRSPDAEEEEVTEVTEAEAADGEVVEAVVAGGWKGKKPGRQPWARPHPSTSSSSLITLRVTLCYNRDTRDSPPCDLT